MSYAVMPLSDYKAACDKVREKVDLTVAKFEDTDFNYIRSVPFAIEGGKTYTLNLKLSDSSLFYEWIIIYPSWAADDSPWLLEYEYKEKYTFSNSYDMEARLFINIRNGLTINDIISASIECDGEVVANFVEPQKIKSGELADKVDEVYEAGRKDEWSEFWEEFQIGGTREYYYSFCVTNGNKGNFWTDKNYNPKYPITPENGYCLFGENTAITDTKVPIVMLGTHMNYAFGGSRNLKTIRSLDISKVTSYISTFYLCYALENITFVGTISVDISFGYCQKLTHESLISIINALYDFSSDTSGKTHKVNLGSGNLAKLTEEEKNIMTRKGWTYS